MFDFLSAFRSDDFELCQNGEEAAVPETPKHGNYMVYRDGRPFLIVNATPNHVRNLVAGFSLESDFSWTYKPYHP